MDDVWAGPAREGAAADIGIRWRVEGTEGMARGTIGLPDYPLRTPSTLEWTTVRAAGEWFKPTWSEPGSRTRLPARWPNCSVRRRAARAGDQRCRQSEDDGTGRRLLRVSERAQGSFAQVASGRGTSEPAETGIATSDSLSLPAGVSSYQSASFCMSPVTVREAAKRTTARPKQRSGAMYIAW